MPEQRFLSEMFQVQPPHWGLRGDPFLWEDMKKAFADTPFPYSAHELVMDIHRLFREKTGEELTNTARPFVEAYAHGEQWLDELLVYLADNMRFIRSFCAERLPELKPNTPEATYLNWVDARALGMDDAALKKFCVEKAGVAFGEGTDFGIGGSGFLRLNAACPRSVIEKALTQMEQAVRSR